MLTSAPRSTACPVVTGAVSSGCVSSSSPSAPSGATSRAIGRDRNEASPVSVILNGAAARLPESSRIVVPELAQSIGPEGSIKRSTGENRSPVRCTPRRPSAASVAATSRPGARPVISLSSSASEAKTKARWDSDLSPGIWTPVLNTPPAGSTVLVSSIVHLLPCLVQRPDLFDGESPTVTGRK